MSVLLYNLLLGLLGAGTLVTQRRRLPVRGLFGFVMAMLGLGLVLGFLFHQHEPLDPMFGAMRMWSYGIFLQLPLMLLAWAWLDRRARPGAARALAAVAIVLAAIGIDAFLVEPTWLEVNEVEIVTSKVKAPMTIAVLADIQSDDIGEYERGAVRAAMAMKPDLILLPGDYIQAKTPKLRDENAARLRAIMQEEGFGAPLGAYAVAGNVDNHLVWPTIFTGRNISTATVSRVFHVNPELSITALTLADSFDAQLEVESQPGLHIVLGHAPDFALGKISADLLVAGHTHGGQVRLPFFGPLVTLSKVPRPWAAGVTARPEGGTLVVSKGIGLERGLAPRLRFNCRPEVLILRLRPDGP